MSIPLPADFSKRITRQFNQDSKELTASLDFSPSTSVRLNPYKPFIHELKDKVLWSEDGYYLSERPIFAIDPLWHGGAYYVQEASSMFLDFILSRMELPKGSRALDLCAAPGGKSTLLATHMYRHQGWLLANEYVRSRAQVLAENLVKWGLPNTTVIHSTPSDLGEKAKGLFDLVVVDAPCSGEGMFRKDRNARSEWSEANVQQCALRQHDILNDIADAVAPGGYLIYSTCTFNTEENEKIVSAFAQERGAEILSFSVPDSWGVTGQPCGGGEVYRFLPHKTRGEGFTIAVLRMPEEGKRAVLKSRKTPFQSHKDILEINGWLQSPEEYNIWSLEGKLFAFPSAFTDEIFWAKSNFSLLHAGIQLGELIGNSIKPLPQAAFSVILNKEAFAQLPLSYSEALHYLSKTDIPVKNNSKGIGLVFFEEIPLGFVNMLGNRYNNLYPKEWRLRMTREESSIFTLAKF